MGATLLFATPLFEHMPLNALGAIVIASVIGLVQYDECMFLWKVRFSSVLFARLVPSPVPCHSRASLAGAQYFFVGTYCCDRADELRASPSFCR